MQIKRAAVGFFILAIGCSVAIARDNGQWGNLDPVISLWFKSLRQPDNPQMSCCGEADSYYVDVSVETIDGQQVVIATINDDRDDSQLGRPHIDNGTRIVVPPHKYKWDRGNPTGRNILFLSYSRDVYCFVQGGGV